MSGITTDSDSSPYASGIPIADNINRVVEMGWDEAEMSLIMSHQNGMTNSSMLEKNGSRKSGTSFSFENNLYPSSHSRVSNYSQDSCSARDSDYDETYNHMTSQPDITTHLKSHSVDDLLLDTDSLLQSVHESLQDNERDLSQSQSSQGFIEYPASPTISVISSQERIYKQSKIAEDMNEADRLCEQMLTGLQTSPDPKNLDEDDDCFSPETDEINFRKYTGRSRHNTESPSSSLLTNRLSVASNSLSFSEPDLVVLSLKAQMSPPIDRVDDENDELMTSLPATILRKFVEPPSTPQHSKNEKHKGGKFKLKGPKKSKCDEKERKSEPSSLGDRRHTLNPSSSLYFTSSNNSKEPHHLSPSRGITSLFKKKNTKEGKKLKKSASMQQGADQFDGGISDALGRKRTKRSSSLAPSLERHVYINIDEFGGKERS